MPCVLYVLRYWKQKNEEKESENMVLTLEEELVVAAQATTSSLDVIIEEIREPDTGVVVEDDESVHL